MQRWVLVNDIHLDPFGSEPALYHETDTSPKLWRSAVEAMHARFGDARVVFVGGDLLAHHWGELAAHAELDPTQAGLDTERGIVRDLGSAFPHAQFLFALGNNDDPCGDYRSETGGAYLTELGTIFAPLVQRNGAAPDFVGEFRRGGYYESTLPNGERVLVLNSVFWSFVYRGACESNPAGAGSSELAWLNAALAQLPSGTRAITLMHVPPGYDGYSTTLLRNVWPVPFFHADDNRAFLATFAQHRAHIAFALAAHTHHFGVRLPSDVPMFVGSSISPVNDNTPAFYELDVAADGDLASITPFVYDPNSGAWRTAALETLVQHGVANDCVPAHLDESYAHCIGTTRRLTVAVVAVVAIMGALVALALVLLRKRRT